MSKILIESREVYDGWCASYDTETKQFEWRDHWAVDRLTQGKKDEIEFNFLKHHT